MRPKKNAVPKARSASEAAAAASASSDKPPAPFGPAPDFLATFVGQLSPKHVYIAHVDTKPADFKRKVFSVPVLMNVVITALLVWRARRAAPYYFDIVAPMLSLDGEAASALAGAPLSVKAGEVLRLTCVFVFDFILFAIVSGWPYEFVAGSARGNPTRWRWKVGFRDSEIYVRRSRGWWDPATTAGAAGDMFASPAAKTNLLEAVGQATTPTLLADKTGYVLMNRYWDLDFASMVHAHALVDGKQLTLDAFRLLVLVHDARYGWMCVDFKTGSPNPAEDERRRQVFAFRDALIAAGKEDLFYRWVELVQFEATKPGGFDAERQAEAAKMIRDMFEKEGVDFDDFWKKSVDESERAT